MLVLREGKQVTDLIREAKKIAICIAGISGVDGFSAGLGLYKTLKTQGKNATILYPFELPQGAESLISSEEVQKTAGTRDLVVNIDYKDTKIEKVHYYVENEVCHIVLHPVSADFDLNKITYSAGGFDYDLIISIGAKKLNDISDMFSDFADKLKETTVVNIDSSSNNENFASLNVVEPESESLCQLIMSKHIAWHYKIGKETAEALLFGLSHKD